MQWTTNVLVVANVTATSPELLAELKARSGAGHTRFMLVVPAQPVVGGRRSAELSLQEALGWMREAGLEVEGRVGSTDPIVAVTDEWDPRCYDEIVLCTLPMRVSKWLHAGLPERVERLTGARVRHVVAEPLKPKVTAGPAPAHEKLGVIAPLSVLSWGAPRDS